MCQLCAINGMLSDIRWPKPLEQHISDLTFLVNTAHDEWKTLDLQFLHKNASPAAPGTTSSSPSTTTIPSLLLASRNAEQRLETHLGLLVDVQTAMTAIEEARAEWWGSHAKCEPRRVWAERGEGDKLVRLQKVNNELKEVMEGCKAKLGGYVVWGLGIREGMEGVEKMMVRAGR